MDLSNLTALSPEAKEKLASVFRGAVLAAIGAVTAMFVDQATHGDYGQYSAIVGALASVVANLARKFLSSDK